MPYAASDRSPVTFSNERGPGAFAPLNALPRRATHKRSLFHIPNDDDHEPSPPPSPPLRTPPDILDQHLGPPSIPFPRSSPVTPSKSPSPPPRVQRTSSSSSIILSNGRPLKSSLKSASSSSIADEMAASRHSRAQSMPSTPAYGPKNVHFKEKDEGLESVRLFRRTGKPASVSKPTSDTETETEPEHSAYPFPYVSSSIAGTSGVSALSEIADSSPIPSPNPDPYSNVHLESINLPPARPPVLRGTVLVRNIVYEKQIGVRFTVDEWTTVSEVIATYSGPVASREMLAGTHEGKTVGDLIGTAHTKGWDRFNFAIRLEDYEAHLWQRTLFLVVRFSAPGTGEWWDNNSGQNYRVSFRSRPGPVSPERRRGASAPSTTPFLMSAGPPAPPVPRVAPHDEPRPTFAPLPQRPPLISRSASSPIPSASSMGVRLNLRHYAAPVAPARNLSPLATPRVPPPSLEASQVVIGGQPATLTPPATPTTPRKELSQDKDEVDEGFATGSEDGDNTEAHPGHRPQLSVKISPPSPAAPAAARPSSSSPTPSPPPRPQGPFSPTREPFSPRVDGGPGDSTYATLIREWCFAQGPDSFGIGGSGNAQNAVPWVGSMS
ncbi:putative phosphatase regulatory subunit-domain-containing protein [Gloeopeniophorella convolvens]|nr:putative phosphatase regulatory subunit-domain-containing protein [Gloeopeniophorella convolvens]